MGLPQAGHILPCSVEKTIPLGLSFFNFFTLPVVNPLVDNFA
jgi:hypothetical protein